MADDTEANAAERRRWNDEYWTSVWPKREALTSAVTEILLGHLKLSEGERVLDVGSGGGILAFAAGRAVGSGGGVVGADISAPLVALARRRAADQQAAHVSFRQADIQQDTVDGAPFDVVASQFGVMFFDEPVTAFANIRRHLIPGGRLGFACWLGIERNPWFIGPALAGLVPSPPPPAPGKTVTGPFTFSDPGHVTDVLAAAGWTAVTRTAHDLVTTVDRDAVVDDPQLSFLGVPDDVLDRARQAVNEHLAPLRRSDGRLDAPLGIQVFTARA